MDGRNRDEASGPPLLQHLLLLPLSPGVRISRRQVLLPGKRRDLKFDIFVNMLALENSGLLAFKL